MNGNNYFSGVDNENIHQDDGQDNNSHDPPSTYYELNGDAARDDEIHELARQITSHSLHTQGGEAINPFIDSTDPALDPNSDKFNSRAWLKHVVNLDKRDPEHHSELTAGVAFKNLGAYGFGTAADYQKTVANVILELVTLAKKATGLEHKTKIQILQNFNGLVKKGELCMVLGRPGR